ncbi:MAG: hypothetical protein LBJ17_04245 [Dysgonamonadaceae bacterium]|jgi:hypothetical protein|nr:hypothetical protein [Dysgonamonadaceae bacterium]
MKQSKKTISGVLAAMILSLGVMQGINVQKQSSNNLIGAAVQYHNYDSWNKDQSTAVSIACLYIGSCVSCGATFCWGGPAGIAAGIVVGL